MGMIAISEDLSWVSSNWAHAAVLRHIAPELGPTRPDMAWAFYRGQIWGPEYAPVDLRQLGSRDLCIVLTAADGAYDRAYAAGPAHVGPSDFTDVDTWVGFLQQLSEFAALVRRDPRAGGGRDAPEARMPPAHTSADPPARLQGADACPVAGRVRGPGGAGWEAPPWVFDLVLEQIAPPLAAAGAALAQRLLAGRVRVGSGLWDAACLGPADAGLVCPILAESEALYASYHQNSASVGQLREAAAVFAEISRSYAALRRVLGCPAGEAMAVDDAGRGADALGLV